MVTDSTADFVYLFEHLTTFLLLPIFHLASVGSNLEGLIRQTGRDAVLLLLLTTLLDLEDGPLANPDDTDI